MNSFRSIEETDKFAASSFCPENLRDLGESPNARLCTEILSELKESLINSQKRSKDLEVASNKFRERFSKRNTFKFKTELNIEADFMEFVDNLSDFLLNEKKSKITVNAPATATPIFSHELQKRLAMSLVKGRK